MSGRPFGEKIEVSETCVSTSRYKRLIFGKCMHKALTHFVDLADENQHNRRTYWYISSNIGKYETEFFQCLQMNFDNSQGRQCQRKLMRYLSDTNCLLQSGALKYKLYIWFIETPQKSILWFMFILLVIILQNIHNLFSYIWCIFTFVWAPCSGSIFESLISSITKIPMGKL